MPHGARSKSNPKGPRHPRPHEVIDARVAAGQTQPEAAATIYSTLRTWQGWEGAGNDRPMHPAFFELYLLKTGQTQRLADWMGGTKR
jgi:putative transcriptional regulator